MNLYVCEVLLLFTNFRSMASNPPPLSFRSLILRFFPAYLIVVVSLFPLHHTRNPYKIYFGYAFFMIHVNRQREREKKKSPERYQSFDFVYVCGLCWHFRFSTLYFIYHAKIFSFHFGAAFSVSSISGSIF